MSAITGVDRVERKELKWRMDRAEPCVILEVLPEEDYRKGHLPGALSVPLDRVADLAPELVPDRDVEVIVYSAHSSCNDGKRAARELEALGYTNVRSYDGGKRDWIDHGMPLENEAERAVSAPGASGGTSRID
jgi:rhodanese-related sulfurtransferase